VSFRPNGSAILLLPMTLVCIQGFPKQLGSPRCFWSPTRKVVIDPGEQILATPPSYEVQSDLA
jgi:hypothetical protein